MPESFLEKGCHALPMIGCVDRDILQFLSGEATDPSVSFLTIEAKEEKGNVAS
jgi:hypothetical protein